MSKTKCIGEVWAGEPGWTVSAYQAPVLARSPRINVVQDFVQDLNWVALQYWSNDELGGPAKVCGKNEQWSRSPGEDAVSVGEHPTRTGEGQNQPRYIMLWGKLGGKLPISTSCLRHKLCGNTRLCCRNILVIFVTLKNKLAYLDCIETLLIIHTVKKWP